MGAFCHEFFFPIYYSQCLFWWFRCCRFGQWDSTEADSCPLTTLYLVVTRVFRILATLLVLHHLFLGEILPSISGAYYFELFEVGRFTFNLDILTLEDMPLVLCCHPVFKKYGRRELSLFLPACVTGPRP